MNRFLPMIVVGVLFTAASPASAQLRIVTYNTLDKPFTATDQSQLRTIFDAIASTPRNGIAKRPDVIGLQEQRTLSGGDSTAARIAAELNDLYGVTTYESFIQGFGTDRIAMVYDTATVDLTATAQVFTTGPRPTLRAQFQPVGYTSSDAALYSYISHLKAGSSSSDQNTRENEATRIRLNSDALGPDANIIYMGDLNLRSFEDSYANLRAPGDGQAVDPLGLSSFPNSGVSEHLTQSTRTTNLSDGGASGGVDDRFDLQLVTDDLLDGEGLSYLGPTSTGLGGLEHSNQAFGNDGVSYNQRINNTLVGRSQSAAVLNALFAFSDHLPVIADYQVPAVLGYELGSIPLTLEQNELFSLDLTVTNDANVVATAGADELDYSIATSGALSGAFSGIEAALGLGDAYELLLDTSVIGNQSGTITLSTTSEGAENSLIEIPVSFDVVSAALAGDYNDDGLVDAADYTVWRDGGTLLNETETIGSVTAEDYTAWANNYGATGTESTAAVPEPAAALLMLIAMTGLARHRDK